METSGCNVICREPYPEHNRILSLKGSKNVINSILLDDNLDFDYQRPADGSFGANALFVSLSYSKMCPFLLYIYGAEFCLETLTYRCYFPANHF